MNEAVETATAIAPGRGVDTDRAGAYQRLLLVLGIVFVVSTVVAGVTLMGDTAGGWGMVTATWLFLTGVTMFGVAFTAIMRLSGGFWARAVPAASRQFSIISCGTGLSENSRTVRRLRTEP